MVSTTYPFDSTLHHVKDNKFVTLFLWEKLILTNRSKLADDWFQRLESAVHSIVNENRKDNQKRVRIAILDTGVDITHPFIHAAYEKNTIVGYFPQSNDETQNCKSYPTGDQHGHGTHGTSVLLRTAPNAAIYVARATNKDGELRYDDIVEVYTCTLVETHVGPGTQVGDS
jgi:hypothetical protein